MEGFWAPSRMAVAKYSWRSRVVEPQSLPVPVAGQISSILSITIQIHDQVPCGTFRTGESGCNLDHARVDCLRGGERPIRLHEQRKWVERSAASY